MALPEKLKEQIREMARKDAKAGKNRLFELYLKRKENSLAKNQQKK